MTDQNQQQIARLEQRIDRGVAENMPVDGTGGVTFQNAVQVMEFAKMMAVAGSAVPKHLRGEPGACLGVLDDAIRFGMSPFALARKSYFVNDNLAYEAQAIAAIVVSRAAISERPIIEFEGEENTGERRCIVTFKLREGGTRVYRSPPVRLISPKNSPLWKTDQDQQLSYYSLRAGSRRYFPEVLLGIYDREEMQAIDVTPEPSPLVAKLAEHAGGFNLEAIKETAEDAVDFQITTDADLDLVLEIEQAVGACKTRFQLAAVNDGYHEQITRATPDAQKEIDEIFASWVDPKAKKSEAAVAEQTTEKAEEA